MTRQTIQSVLQGSPMAISTEHARPLLAMAMPDFTAEAMAAVTIEAGERYAINRGVAVVPIRGLLTPNMDLFERYFGWSTYAGIAESMAALAANEDVSAVVCVLDTPGGSVLGIETAARAIAAAVKVKPVHVLVDFMALSAGYYLASQASDIAATDGAWVGSIGVGVTAAAYVQPSVNSGAQIFQMTSGHARAKWPDASTDAGRAEFQRELDLMEADFHAAVAAGRGIPPGDLPSRLSVTDDPADGGAVFWGKDAVARGLVDRIETAPAFWQRMAATYAPRPAKRGRSAMALSAAALASAAL